MSSLSRVPRIKMRCLFFLFFFFIFFLYFFLFLYPPSFLSLFTSICPPRIERFPLEGNKVTQVANP